MSNSKFELSGENVVSCALYALIGLALVIFQSGCLSILFTIIGALLVLAGLVDIFNNGKTVQGIIEAVVGAVIIVGGWLIADIVLMILGILFIISGVMEIIQNRGSGFMAILPSIVLIVIGVLLVIAKWALLDLFCIIAGAVFLVNAVLVLFGKGAETKQVVIQPKK